MIEDTWRKTLTRAGKLPGESLLERVDDEWSFVETLRHLILATDCWLRRMVMGIDRPYHPWGLAGSWLADPAAWGIDPDASPTLAEVLEVRRARMDEVQRTIATVTPAEIERVCVPPDAPGHPTHEHTVAECLHVILAEEWEHNRYAVRDLDASSPRRRVTVSRSRRLPECRLQRRSRTGLDASDVPRHDLLGPASRRSQQPRSPE